MGGGFRVGNKTALQSSMSADPKLPAVLDCNIPVHLCDPGTPLFRLCDQEDAPGSVPSGTRPAEVVASLL